MTLSHHTPTKTRMGKDVSIEVLDIDALIESYDIQEDPILQGEFIPIESRLWEAIENYADDGEEYTPYGEVMSRHLQRTSAVGRQFITVELGFSEKAGRNFYDANLFHDLGKTHTCYHPSIWTLPHRPTPEERIEKRAHTQLGVELVDFALLKASKELQEHPHIQLIQALQLLHHERLDGEGYEGKKAGDLGQIIQAICIIDAFDGDMIQRPHQRNQRSPEEALKRMQTAEKYENAFNPELLQRFIDFQLADS